MKVAVVNEISSRDKNIDIVSSLKRAGIEAFNAGMEKGDFSVELTYIHTGLIAGMLLNLEAADMVIGGCGTGQGFMMSAMQYPNVYCGLIIEPLDAWLFSQINGGNCVSLALNKGYGWAGSLNVENIIEKLFKDEPGKGYPPERAFSQGESRLRLRNISNSAHRPMQEILSMIEPSIIDTVMSHRPFTEIIKSESRNLELKQIILSRYL